MAPTERPSVDRGRAARGRDAPDPHGVSGPSERTVDHPDDPWPDEREPDTPAAHGRVERVTSWLRATPAELAALALLCVGAVAVSVLLWTGANGRPATLPATADGGGAAAVGQPAGTPDEPGAGAVGGIGEAATTGDPARDGSGDTGATGGPASAWPADADPGQAVLAEQHAGHGSPGASDPAPAAPLPSSQPPGPLTVHVSGAVARPGLVELPAGSRVGHAVEAAGGLGPGADLATINLARPLVDGEQVHVLREGEASPAPVAEPPAAVDGSAVDPGGAASGGGTAGAAGAEAGDGRIDLNRATVEELETLPGIGPAKAAAIVEHRETHGPFAEPGDIRAVSGIGEKTFQQLADRISTG